MSFPFLLLPLEIRRPIYRYALPHSVDDYSLDCQAPVTSGPDDAAMQKNYRFRTINACPIRWCQGTCPNVLYISRQVHEEACEVLYHENTFSLFVRHPRQPRLPMNESRADEETFLYISWSHRNWSHPRNRRIPLANLRHHKHFARVPRLHVDLPEMSDLLGADMYMRTTSYASHHGLGAWVEMVSANGGTLSDPDQERMSYIKQIKAPIDEVADFLRTLPFVKHLILVFKSESHEVTFLEYVISSLLRLRGFKRADCLHQWSLGKRQLVRDSRSVELRDHMMAPRVHQLESDLESLDEPRPDPQAPNLSAEAIEMLTLLQAVRDKQLLIHELRSEYEDVAVDAALPFFTHILRV